MLQPEGDTVTSSAKRFLAVSFVLLVMGLAFTYVFAVHAALYEPVCERFALDSPKPVCRNAVLYILISAGIAGTGVLMLLGSAARGLFRVGRRAGRAAL